MVLKKSFQIKFEGNCNALAWAPKRFLRNSCRTLILMEWATSLWKLKKNVCLIAFLTLSMFSLNRLNKFYFVPEILIAHRQSSNLVLNTCEVPTVC